MIACPVLSVRSMRVCLLLRSLEQQLLYRQVVVLRKMRFGRDKTADEPALVLQQRKNIKEYTAWIKYLKPCLHPLLYWMRCLAEGICGGKKIRTTPGVPVLIVLLTVDEKILLAING